MRRFCAGVLLFAVFMGCTSKKKGSPPSGPVPTAVPTLQSTVPSVVLPTATAVATANYASGQAAPLDVTALTPPEQWSPGAGLSDASTSELEGEVAKLLSLAASFDVQPESPEALTSVEYVVEDCARQYLRKLSFQASQQDFVVRTPAPDEGLDTCVKAARVASTSGYSYTFSHGMGVQCVQSNFSRFDGKPVIAAKDGLCLEGSKGDWLFNSSLTVEEGGKKYRHTRGLQGVQSSVCSHASAQGERTWNDCQWVEKVERDGAGLKFMSVKYQKTKAAIGSSKVYLTGGALEVEIGQWKGQVQLAPGHATWSLTHSQGTVKSGQLDIEQKPEGDAAPGSGSVGSDPDAGTSVVGSPKTLACDSELASLLASGTPRVQKGETTIFAGFRQMEGNNRNPIVIRFDGERRAWCREDYETGDDASMAYGVLWDGSQGLYAVMSSVGTGVGDGRDLGRHATSGWLPAYGVGDGALVSVLVQLNESTGAPVGATYLKAQRSDDSTNAFVVRGLSFVSSGVKIEADAWSAPLGVGRARMNCTGDGPFRYTLVLDRALGSALTAAASECRAE